MGADRTLPRPLRARACLNSLQRLHAVLDERDGDEDGRAAQPGHAVHSDGAARRVRAAERSLADAQPLGDDGVRRRVAIWERRVLCGGSVEAGIDADT